MAEVPVRSRRSQLQAGGTERRAGDDGGHYIAARFNGPTEAFNHFAQDANFNRGRYRALEDQWARNKRSGKHVAVKIVPRFEGRSTRPAAIDVSWTTDGKIKALSFPMSEWKNRVANDETEHLLAEIGQLLAEGGEYPLDETLLYARLGRNVVGASIFKAFGNHILYRGPGPDALSYALLDLWKAQVADDRWSRIEYLVRDGKFDVTYTYPDEIDPEEDWNERRARVVKRHFGDKPTVYPPDDDDDVPSYEV